MALIYRLGQRLFLPLVSGISMELSAGKRDGRIMGQFQDAQNLAACAPTSTD